MKLQIDNAPASYQTVLNRMAIEKIIPRIWEHDHTVWASGPDEVDNRLGWLHLPRTMVSQIPRIAEFVASVRAEGFTQAVLLGMGGSSLAPDMLSRIFGTQQPGSLALRILDSTHPIAVQQMTDLIPIDKTLFIVSTKSGTTSETLSLFRTFYQHAVTALGEDNAGDHFIAITDPGSPLINIATDHAFRDIFLNDPTLGGRYSALSLFGLIPAALLGLNIDSLLQQAQSAADQCGPKTTTSDNPAAQSGAFLGACARAGQDKATFLLSENIAPLGDWIEQLIAESTGKDGKGLVPVLEPVSSELPNYSEDRAFIAIRLGENPLQDAAVRNLIEQAKPVLQIELDDLFEIAGQFYVWEFATSIACHILGVHPFNQPNVESAKELARDMASESRRTGMSPQLPRRPISRERITSFLGSVSEGDYVAIHAYLPPTPELTDTLRRLQIAIRDRYRVAATVAYGPRFLHSTGQLHKGDRGNGHFIQLISEAMPQLAIPDSANSAESSLSFGSMIRSQALGDRRALENGNRPVLTLCVSTAEAKIIQTVAISIAEAS